MKAQNVLAEYLIKYIESGCKESKNIGIELEHFVLYRETREAVPLYGTGGVEEILKKLIQCLPQAKMLGYSALIKGLLYADDILDECQNFIRKHNITEFEYRMSQKSLKENGFGGEIYGIKAERLLGQLIEAARERLASDEQHYLDIYNVVL